MAVARMPLTLPFSPDGSSLGALQIPNMWSFSVGLPDRSATAADLLAARYLSQVS